MTSAASTQDPLADQASFVFKGTVNKLKAATMSNVPVTSRTAIVRVDEILQAPKLLSGYQGQNITVQLKKAEKVKEGQQAVFYTNAWLFGDSVAVQSAGHRDVTESVLATAQGESAVSAKRDRDLHEHLRDADVVVKGKVVSVGLPKKAASKTKASKENATTRYSEHSPKWNEAIVDVESVEKGRKLQKRITVQFPRSDDVAWRRAPKLDPGQEGIFLLHKSPTKGAAKKQATGTIKKQSYVVLHDDDFLPADKASHVRSLIQSTTSSKSSKKSR
jgi:hypothetical protein